MEHFGGLYMSLKKFYYADKSMRSSHGAFPEQKNVIVFPKNMSRLNWSLNGAFSEVGVFL